MRELPTNDLIRKRLGKDHPIPLGWTVLVETYTSGSNFKSSDGSDSDFIRPDVAIDRDQYHSCIAQILMCGSAAFKGEKFKYWDTLPQVGDFVEVKKYGGILKARINPETGEVVHTQDVKDILIRLIDPNPSHH